MTDPIRDQIAKIWGNYHMNDAIEAWMKVKQRVQTAINMEAVRADTIDLDILVAIHTLAVITMMHVQSSERREPK